MSAVCAAGGAQRLMDAPSCLRISFRFVPSRFLVSPTGQLAAAPLGYHALLRGTSTGPRRPAIRRSACDPWSGLDRARARRPGRTAASPPSAAPGPAVPSAATRHTAACRAASQPPVTNLRCQAQWALDGIGPGRQASPSCPRPPRGPGTEREAARRRRPPSGTPTPQPTPSRLAVPLQSAPGAGWPAGDCRDRRRCRPPRP